MSKIKNLNLNLSLHGCFLAIPLLSGFFPFFFSRTRHRGCRAKARRQATTNILAQLCFAPGDSQHYRSLGVDASFFTIPGYSHSPSHAICSSSVFLFP